MLISEIFHSVQGEGELTGVPSIFVRTSGCNLRCSWCDTKYASWTPEGEDLSVEVILNQIMAIPADHCVLTGGEPMIAKGLHDLARNLRNMGKHITIETAGTVAPNGIACDLASLSPKLRHSAPGHGTIANGWIKRHEERRLNLPVLQEWITSYPYQLKFVVSTEGDLEEILLLVRSLQIKVPPAKILIMPEGTDPDTLKVRSDFVVKACKTHGFRYCARLHIDLFGNSKGT
jgi:7-carboxy-7-deazaguanine synthase